MIDDKITIKGAREHNLKNVNVEIPRGKITVITGLSGSGKSTLAFDTLYAEGQRRYVESLSAYARQFLGLMNKPDVDSIDGLSPAISIDQKTTSRNPRSTVGTVTEIYDYLRLLYARIGKPHCPVCKKPISKQGPDEISANLYSVWAGQKIEILWPLARGEKGMFEKEFEKLRKGGFYRLYVNGTLTDISDSLPKLDKNKKHAISVLVDKAALSAEGRERVHEAIESALKENGIMLARCGKEERMYSRKNACPEHGISLGEIQPRDFSFNSPFGACPECHGLGFKMEFDPDLIIPDRSLSIIDGAITCYGRLMEGGWRLQQVRDVAINNSIDIEVPVSRIPKEKLDVLLYGTKEKMKFKFESKSGGTYQYEGEFEGIIPQLERLFHQTQSEGRKEEIAKFMREKTCPKCAGKRLKDEMLHVLVGNKNIMEFCELPIGGSRGFISSLKLGESERKIAAPIIKEIGSRLEFLENVGLNYLNLSRESATLSGGESQRIRLATQIGSNLTGIIYVLDEPSIGLHQRDNSKLLATLKRLRDLGNTLVVVEHDEETMMEADHIIDMGPGAGRLGGQVVAEGTAPAIMKSAGSVTGDYLAGRKCIPVPKERRKATATLELVGASENNLKNVYVGFPLGVLTCVTGVSGSGKSSLVSETLFPALSNLLMGSKLKTGKLEAMRGSEKLDKIITVDQSPIGRTPRSNPATYVGVFTPIRELFSKTPESKARGYTPGRFSFNVAEGRCDNCEGDGLIKIEMHFLADVYVPCEVCKGKRYDSQTLEITYKGKNISDVLDMSVDEAFDFFQNIPQIRHKLETIRDVGLGYIKLGQPATTLSGGEAQRVKLANELSRRSTGMTMYLLDEPTTGLHFDDVSKLLSVLQRLVEKGNTVVVIEHNLDVIKSADWIIDLGPEGGAEGGRVVAHGTPEKVAAAKTHTAQYLKKALGGKNGTES
ncbi:MAG TPA: excinuclease ABC subunit UvrA [Candidatus Bilamarchaeum sp.]|nr:excinuclease ABC subunit UvrA [Candidatus Bilamarchaeum sp.]